jgi:hypothetical protein
MVICVYIEVRGTQVDLQINDEGWVNITALAKTRNHRTQPYFVLDRSASFLNALATHLGMMPFKATVGRFGATWMHPLGVPDFLSWLCPKMAADYATGTDVRYRRGYDGIDPFFGWRDLLNSDRQARTVHRDSPFWNLLPADGTRHDPVLREIFNADRTSLRAFRLCGVHGNGDWLYVDVSWRTRLQPMEIDAIEVHLETAYSNALHEWKYLDTSRPVLEASIPKSSYLQLLERRGLCLTQADELLRHYLPEVCYV